MSLKDKMMAQAGSLVEKGKELADQGKDKVEELQAKRARDQLIEQLGNAAYAAAKGADQGEVERLVAAIDAHDAASS